LNNLGICDNHLCEFCFFFFVIGFSYNFNLFCGQVNDVNGLEDPFGNLRIGQIVTARIVAKAKQSDKKNYQWELSLKPKILTGNKTYT
jgi:L-rhamnose isomerase